MPEMTMKEIYTEIDKLLTQQLHDWDQIWGDIGHKDGNKSKEATYAKLSFDKLLEVLRSIENFGNGMPPYVGRHQYGKLLEAALKFNYARLSPEDKEYLRRIESTYDRGLGAFSDATKEHSAIQEVLKSRVKEVVASDYPRKYIPQDIPFAATTYIFSEIYKVVSSGKLPDSKLNTLADLILFMYAKTPKKSKKNAAKMMQEHLQFPGFPNKFLKALDTQTKFLFADEHQSKLFSEEDKTVLKALFEQKSLFTRIFRKKSAELEQKMIIDQALAQGKDKTL